jgi:hypothetical protein
LIVVATASDVLSSARTSLGLCEAGGVDDIYLAASVRRLAGLQAGIVAELAKCPDGERRAGLLRTLERTDAELAIMRRMAGRTATRPREKTGPGLEPRFCVVGGTGSSWPCVCCATKPSISSPTRRRDPLPERQWYRMLCRPCDNFCCRLSEAHDAPLHPDAPSPPHR